MKSYKLLSKPSTNAKTKKGDGDEYLTAILYLAPSNIAGAITVCPYAKIAKCEEGCLYTAGMGRFNSVKEARINKTKWLFNNPIEWHRQLEYDLEYFSNYCYNRDIKPVVRLNGTSDLDWTDVISEYPLIQFYDYTKVWSRAYWQLPKNYHLTLSYSESNDTYADKIYNAAVETNTNMAVVFRNEKPDQFKGMPVIDGDKDDLRFLDPKGPVVVGLKAKGQAKKDNGGFVIDA